MVVSWRLRKYPSFSKQAHDHSNGLASKQASEQAYEWSIELATLTQKTITQVLSRLAFLLAEIDSFCERIDTVANATALASPATFTMMMMKMVTKEKTNNWNPVDYWENHMIKHWEVSSCCATVYRIHNCQLALIEVNRLTMALPIDSV